jgi:hypothetical protein
MHGFHNVDAYVSANESNAEVLAFLERTAVRVEGGGYGERAHPDLTELLRDAGKFVHATFAYAYGAPTLTSANGVMFAYALGVENLVFRAPADGFERPLPAGSANADTIRGWVSTAAWLGSHADWTVREGDAAIRERFVEAQRAAERLAG